MIFGKISPGESVFVDSNTLIYHFAQDHSFGAASTEFFERIARGELFGFVSTHILIETSHRLMLLEAQRTFGWPIPGTQRRLHKQPARIRQLSQFVASIADLARSPLTALPITLQTVLSSNELAARIGLLSNDALTVAVMQENGIANLASHDSDFDRVPGIKRYGPL